MVHQHQQTVGVARAYLSTCWGLRQSPWCCVLPGDAPAPHLQGAEAAMQIVQSRGKDELPKGTS